MKKGITRRDFIGTTALAGVGAMITGPGPIFAKRGAPADVEMWYDRTMRWMQLILVEDDPGQFDPQWWIDFFKRSHSDGLCISGGGLTAYYPTEIPFHHKSKWMNEGDDPFGELVRGAQELGMSVIVRTDSHSCLDDAAKAHPEWLNIDENGDPRRHWEMPESRWVTCALGPYNFDFMDRVHQEIFEKYQTDGLFCNRWQAEARGMCYCESCQKLFKDYSGQDLPREGSSPELIARYMEWETARLTELWKLWDGTIRKAKPTARYFSNTGIDIDVAAELAPTYLCEKQARRSGAPWDFGHSGKQFRSIFGKKPIIGIAGVTLSSRQSVAPESEIKIWLLNAITNGLRPWTLKTSGMIRDKRWAPALEKVYSWHYENEKYMRNEENLARVAMLFMESKPRNPVSKSLYAARNVGVNVDAANGMYQALVESRIPFEMAYSRKLEAEDIDRYKLLILPSLSDMSDEVCEKLRQYVNRGGSILATYQTSLLSDGEERSNFGLADLFGVDYAGSSESNGNNAYMRLEHETNHPFLKGLEETEWIVATNNRVHIREVESFSNPSLTSIPTFPTIPMEEIYPRSPETDIPEVFAREINDQSRIVYFPGDIGATFANGMATDLATVINNAVEWATNEPQPVTVNGPGILDITCWKQANSMTVHMLNCTNPFMLHSSYREDIPIGSQRVTIRIPEGENVGEVKLLVAGKTPEVERAGNVLTITVPQIIDHEVIAVDFT